MKGILIHQYVSDSGQEEKLLLLLWKAKSDLFVQAVHLSAEKQPLQDSQTMGFRLGTKLKEKIFKAIGFRKPAVVRLVKVFNKRYNDYISQFPNNPMMGSNEYPLTYEAFEAMPLDHQFWNDGIYYHSKEPWAISADVRTGIIRLQMFVDNPELSRASSSSQGGEFEDVAGEDVELDHIDLLNLGNLPRIKKLQLINKELQVRRHDVGALAQAWSADITWLWSRCQPIENRRNMEQWVSLLERVYQEGKEQKEPNINKEDSNVNEINDMFEDVVLGVQMDDGEEVDDEWLEENEGVV
ncbi:hypothetical protein PGT21_007751 [Puccinia graminis f. sp. tritici]|uniref:Uncharacterized protein n=1 Tax=Puccinia graminis f. sp. tritici TaxID=56615 RepID=A0A5B0P1S5_PUCGR|nr:hypothetical protein PGT21_007751 [Puccinia graminis f. sp. tritici]